MRAYTDLRGKSYFIIHLLAPILLATSAHAISSQDKPIDRALRKLAAEVFDETTDGISQGDLKKLVETGESQDWRLKRKDGYCAAATDKNPHTNSEVTVCVLPGGQDKVVKVTIQNEYLHAEHYFKMDNGSSLKPLSQSNKMKAKLKSRKGA